MVESGSFPTALKKLSKRLSPKNSDPIVLGIWVHLWMSLLFTVLNGHGLGSKHGGRQGDMKAKKGQKKIEGEMQEDQGVEGLSADSMLKPIGDLTIFEASQFHADLCSLHKQEGPLELDLTEIDRMDSSCVQLIVAATRSGRVTLKGYSSQIRDRFEQIGFAQFLPTEQDAS